MQALRRAARPLLLGSLGVLWAAAHTLANELARPQSGHLHHHHHDGGQQGLQGYASYLPTSLALCLTLAVGVAAVAALGRRNTIASGGSLWLFGLVPVLGFVGHLLLSGGVAAELVPVLLVGLLVQLPFALVAVALGGRILLLVERVARAAWGARDRLPRTGAPQCGASPPRVLPTWIVVRANGPRAPPAPAVS